jgi:hypothetical protein
MDPNIGKTTIGKEGLLQCAKDHYQRRVVLIETVFWKCRQKSECMTSDKQTLLAEANASAKRNLMSVGGCADTPVDADGGGKERGDYQEWSCEDFSQTPGGKDLSKMKPQYEMFVESVGSKHVTV